MGYQIRYGQAGMSVERKAIPNKPKGLSRGLFLLLCVVLCCAVIAVWCVPQIREVTAELLLPGDSQTTSVALEQLIRAIEDGQPIQTALTEFCREIIDHGLQAA